MGMKTLAARIIRTFGFRNLMTVNAIVSAFFLGVCALFTVTTPLLIIMVILVVGGFFRSLEFTAINTVAYADVETAQMSRATTLVSVNQQLAVSAGVAVGAACVETTMWFNHVSEIDATVFAPAFVVIALTSAASSWFFWQMPADAGHEISGRKAVEIASRKGAGKERGQGGRQGRDRGYPGRAGSAAGLKRARVLLARTCELLTSLRRLPIVSPHSKTPVRTRSRKIVFVGLAGHRRPPRGTSA